MTDSSELEPGTRIDGRYRIVGPLGKGGMGVVYRAKDERLGRHVAIKMLPPERVGDERARARLVREARAAAALEHPGIAAVYDVGEMENGGAYLVMELVRGQSLRALMQTGALAKDELLRVFGELAAALDHAHSQGVVHRDIKPDNAMVRDDGRAALLDFGLAKDVGMASADTIAPDTPAEDAFATREGMLIGTLSYLAPEQARGQDVGPKSDQFALATTAYEAFVGRLPWDGSNTAAVLAQILVDDAPPPSSLDAALTPAIDAVFARALAKEPEARFESASAFVRALRDAFDAPQPAAPLLGERPPAAPARSGLPRIVATLLVGIGAAALMSLYWAHEEEDPIAPSGLADDVVIGCPVVEAGGSRPWLGAMVGDLACRRMAWHLGGDPARVRTPAELLDLPRVASESFPPDPFAESAARDRTLAAARELGAFIDGSVELGADEMRVTLRLHGASGETLATAEGRGAALYVATGEAIDALVRTEGFPRREQIDAALVPWVGMERTETAILYDELGEAALTGVGVEERCRALFARMDEAALIGGEIRRLCTRWEVRGAADVQPPALDESTPARLAFTAVEHASELPDERVRAFATQLAEAREGESRPFARATLAKSEILLWQRLEETERARDLLLIAAPDLPTDWFLRVHFVRLMMRSSGAAAATRALAAWRPGSPEAWRTLALPMRGDPERSLPLFRRAYESGGTLPLHGIYLAEALLRADQREEARAIAARYATGGPRVRLAGEYLRARVEISESRFGRAHERLGAALAELARFGRLVDGDVETMVWHLDLARVLGKESEAADSLVSRFVLADPHRLAIEQPHYEQPAIVLCMSASPALRAPCLARLRALRDERGAQAGGVESAELLLRGAERYAEGDMRGATDAWRPLVAQRSLSVRSEAFAAVGEDALVERIERSQLAQDGFAGARLAHARAAQRALAAGDAARARELAEQVVRAWGTADVPVPAVEEMRTLLDGLPPAPQ